MMGGRESDLDFAHDPRLGVRMGSPRGARLVIWTVLLFVCAALAWASQAQLDEVTRGQGRVIPSSQVQVIQNLEGGIVAEILVREGALVEADQVLLRIDDTGFASELNEQRAKYLALAAREARLEAEAVGSAFDPPAELARGAPEAVQRERALHDDRARELVNRQASLRERLDQRRQELREYSSRLGHLRRRLSLVQRELELTRPLVRSGVVAEVEGLRLEREAAALREDIETTELGIPRLEAAAREVESEYANLTLAFRAQAREELARTAAEVAAMAEAQVAVKNRVQRTLVRSPVRGTVNRLLVNTVGGVVRPGMNLVEIVPIDDDLLVEVRFRPSDIAFLRPGLPAMVKITAYDFLIYGGLEGEVEHISADSIVDERGNSHYLARVRTQSNSLGSAEAPLPIIPGMIAEVDVLTGHKTVLQYLAKPILRARQQALTER